MSVVPQCEALKKTYHFEPGAKRQEVASLSASTNPYFLIYKNRGNVMN